MTCTIPQGKPGHANDCEHNTRKRKPRTIADLRAENARLRAALMEVAHGCLTADGRPDLDAIDRVARAALRGDPK